MTAVLITTGGELNERNYKGALQLVEVFRKDMGKDTRVLGMISTPSSAEEFIQSAQHNENIIALLKVRPGVHPFLTLAHLAPETVSIHPRKISIVRAKNFPLTENEWKKSLDWIVYRAQNPRYQTRGSS